MHGGSRKYRAFSIPVGTIRRAAIAAVPLAALIPISAFALEGPLSGHLSAGTYAITDDIWVASGQTLTLAPGVVFEFEDSFWEEFDFDVNGTLFAEGTVGTPIIFRASSGVPEFNYLRLATSSSVMRHCVVRDVGSVSLLSQGGLWIDDCRPLIEDCEIVSAGWHGIYVTGSSSLPTIRRTVSHGNTGDGIDAADGAGLHIENCTVYGNGGDGICIAGGSNTIVGSLVYGNGEDGIDCNGTSDHDAAIVNCTVGPHPGEGLSDDSGYRLYNTLAVDVNDGVSVAEHSLVIDDLSFFGFVNPGADDYRLSASSPAVNYGQGFGVAGSSLPAKDLAGNDRIQGIVDAGAFESSHAVDPGTSGTWFSRNLLAPRMGQPVLRERGECFTAILGLMGSYPIGQVQARLADVDGTTRTLIVSGVAEQDLAPGTDLDMMVYSPGLETLQLITLSIPMGTPGGFYGIEIDIGGFHYFSKRAVRVYDEYPSSWGFIHITDTHIGYDQETYTAAERLQFFVAEANFLDPELVVITGDICENQNLGHDWPQQFLDAVAALEVPIYVIPGNHDHYNDGQEHNPAGWLRYFHEINRYENSRLDLGDARFYGLNSQFDYELVDFYRCHGPSEAALDWVEADASLLAPSEKPRFLLMHGPTYDYFSWNMTGAGRIRDIMNAYAFDLGPAGHTHRFETFRNSGDNYLGRNDFEHEDDWGRDEPFPGYPLHTQTSSLGKEEHLSARMAGELRAMEPAEADSVASGMGFPDAEALIAELERHQGTARRGLFGDDIGWRWVQVDGTEVTFFTADTDGDGYRSTEDPWLLGEIRFTVENRPDGSIVSSVENLHFETWRGVRHFIPADPAMEYLVGGGTLVRRLPDGRAIVAVDAVGPLSTSVVTLSPAAGIEDEGAPHALCLFPAVPNPFNPTTRIAYDLPRAGNVRLEVYSAAGRRVATLWSGRMSAGSHEAAWHGTDDNGFEVGSGVYFARLESGGRIAETRMVLVR